MAERLRDRLARMLGSVLSGSGSRSGPGSTPVRDLAPPPPGRQGRPSRPGRPGRLGPDPSTPRGAAPGDFTGTANLTYAPKDDGRPDPGEVVWAWVPFEEDRSQGKDRPVLVVAREGGDLLALMLTSQDHDRDEAQEVRHGRHWMDIGSGGWDRSGRPSEVRLDRILRLDPEAVRREGAVLDRATYDQVAAGVRRVQGW
jgi:PemK-like, MazF-like toxin of type II toxin-antitoxin system